MFACAHQAQVFIAFSAVVFNLCDRCICFDVPLSPLRVIGKDKEVRIADFFEHCVHCPLVILKAEEAMDLICSGVGT